MNNKVSILNLQNLLQTLPMLNTKHQAYIGSLIGKDGRITLYRGIRQEGANTENVLDNERSKGFVAMAKDIDTAKGYIGDSGILLTYHSIPTENIILCLSVFSEVIPKKDTDEILVKLDDSILSSCVVSTQINESGINRASKEWCYGSELQRRILRMIANNSIEVSQEKAKHPLSDILDE